jgi:AcrR family transcriptional regulator
VKKAGKASSRQSQGERRQSLIEAAKVEFAGKGYHATTVDDITRQAGVAKGTFYLYFSEKREIYYEVISSFMQLIKDIGSAVGAEPTDIGDFIRRAERAAIELMEIFMDNRELARLAYRESMGLDPTLETMIGDFYREIADVEARNIQVAMELGFIRKVNPLLTAYAHIGTVERVMLALVDNPDDFGEPADVVRELMLLAWEGLRRPNAPSPFPQD